MCLTPRCQERGRTAKLLAALGDVAGLVLLDLGSPGLLLGLELQPAHMLAGLSDALPRRHQGAVSLPLGHLGAHDPLTGLGDAGVDPTDGAVAKRPVQDAAAAVGGAAGRRRGPACAARRRRGRRATAAEETVLLATFFVDRLRGRGRDRFTLAAEETVPLAGLLLDWLLLNWDRLLVTGEETMLLGGLMLDWQGLNRGWLLVTREERHVDGAW